MIFPAACFLFQFAAFYKVHFMLLASANYIPAIAECLRICCCSTVFVFQ